jgi:hypothetical protein
MVGGQNTQKGDCGARQDCEYRALSE